MNWLLCTLSSTVRYIEYETWPFVGLLWGRAHASGRAWAFWYQWEYSRLFSHKEVICATVSSLEWVNVFSLKNFVCLLITCTWVSFCNGNVGHTRRLPGQWYRRSFAMGWSPPGTKERIFWKNYFSTTVADVPSVYRLGFSSYAFDNIGWIDHYLSWRRISTIGAIPVPMNIWRYKYDFTFP